MIAEIALIGGLYWLWKDKAVPTTTDENEGDTGDSTPPPLPVTPTGDSYRIEKVGAGDKSNIYLLQTRRGVLYNDGSGGYSWEDSGFIRGDFPTGFVTANTDTGTTSFKINEVWYKRVLVYATKEEAIEADKVQETTPDSPQKQPEDDEDDAPSLPPLNPPFGGGGSGGLGGGMGSYFGGGY